MKSIIKIIPMTRGITNPAGLVAIDPLTVIATRKLTSVTVSVIIPIKSIRCFLAFVGMLRFNFFYSLQMFFAGIQFEDYSI